MVIRSLCDPVQDVIFLVCWLRNKLDEAKVKSLYHFNSQDEIFYIINALL